MCFASYSDTGTNSLEFQGNGASRAVKEPSLISTRVPKFTECQIRDLQIREGFLEEEASG